MVSNSEGLMSVDQLLGYLHGVFESYDKLCYYNTVLPSFERVLIDEDNSVRWVSFWHLKLIGKELLLGTGGLLVCDLHNILVSKLEQTVMRFLSKCRECQSILIHKCVGGTKTYRLGPGYRALDFESKTFSERAIFDAFIEPFSNDTDDGDGRGRG